MDRTVPIPLSRDPEFSSFAAGPSPGALHRRRAVKVRARGRASYRGELRRQYLNRARYYQPSIGRFIQEDPLGSYDGKIRAVTARLYGYANNSPMLYGDPTGFVTKCVGPTNFQFVGPRSMLHWRGFNQFFNARNPGNWNLLWLDRKSVV